jgi:hypothetical protein
MRLNTIVTICLVAAVPAAAGAKTREKPPQSPLVQALAGCRAQTDDAARLRCYDAAAGALTAAAAEGNVVVVDQQDLKQARRSLFGFSLPKLPFFGGDRSAEDAPEELTAKISSARALGYGKWQVRIEDGAVWETTDSFGNMREPRPGNEVLIKRGALGSYMMRIAGQRAVRAKRVG